MQNSVPPLRVFHGKATGLSVILLLLLVPAAALASQSPDRTSTSQREAIEAAVIAREKGYYRALETQDAKYLQSLETKDAICIMVLANPVVPTMVTDSGGSFDWEDFFRRMPPLAKGTAYLVSQERVRIYNDTAILCYRLTAIRDGLPILKERSKVVGTISYVTSVYVRQNDNWLRAHRHVSEEPPKDTDTR